MTFLEKVFSNKRLVVVALFMSIAAVFVGFMTASHDREPDWIQTMFIVIFSLVAVAAFGMAEAEFMRIARSVREGAERQSPVRQPSRMREVLANAEREVQRLRELGWTRSDFGRAVAATASDETETTREVS